VHGAGCSLPPRREHTAPDEAPQLLTRTVHPYFDGVHAQAEVAGDLSITQFSNFPKQPNLAIVR